MRARYLLILSIALLCRGIAAQAGITIDTVRVGDVGNESDTTSFGSVGYMYNIGEYEVTVGQYTAFLNATAATDTYGLYNTEMARTTNGSGITRSGNSGSYKYSVASDFANRPVNYVSFWDSCRFANWLHNGQPTGLQNASTTERGAYTLDGCLGFGGAEIQRNAGWKWAVTSDDEWYKAAYYKGGSTNAGYWMYPTCSNTVPGCDMADASGNNANIHIGSGPYPIDSGKYTTVVGQFHNSHGPYGTFDQGGNVWEWTDIVPYSSYRCNRGGSYSGMYGYGLQAINRYKSWPSAEIPNIGFRIVQAVPEPPSVLAMLTGLGSLGLASRRRKVTRRSRRGGCL